MQKFRKLIVGAVVLAPISTLAVVSATVLPASATPLFHCAVSATVNFAGGGLSQAGSDVGLTGKTSTTTVTGGALSGGGVCTGTPFGTLSITSKNAKCSAPATPATSCVAKKDYYTGTWAQFATSGGSIGKSLKHLTITVNGITYGFKGLSASEVVGGACGADVGFSISGTVKAPKTAKGLTSTLLACLGTDTGTGTSGNFGSDFGSPTAVVATAQIDPALSYVQIGS